MEDNILYDINYNIIKPNTIVYRHYFDGDAYVVNITNKHRNEMWSIDSIVYTTFRKYNDIQRVMTNYKFKLKLD